MGPLGHSSFYVCLPPPCCCSALLLQPQPTGEMWAPQQWPTSDPARIDSFYWNLIKGRILYTAALHGNASAGQALCSQYALHVAALADSTRRRLGPLMEPDLRGAAYIAAVAQPRGCAGVAGLPSKQQAWRAMLELWQVRAGGKLTKTHKNKQL